MSLWERQYSFMALDDEYLNIDGSCGRCEAPQRPNHFSIKTRICTSMLSLIGFCLFILAVSAPVTKLAVQSTSQPTWTTNCGSDPEEARARNCRFDIMSFSWLPPQCYDEQLVEDFRKVRDWQYFTSSNHSNEVPEVEAMLGEQNLYVRWEHHLHHCAYMWRKLHRAVAAGWPIDGYIANYHHTIHCGSMLVDEHRLYDLEDLNTIIMVKYPACSGKLGSLAQRAEGTDVF